MHFSYTNTEDELKRLIERADDWYSRTVLEDMVEILSEYKELKQTMKFLKTENEMLKSNN